jgi:hypothetical protein
MVPAGGIPSARIENDRTGWPSYAPYGASGEIVGKPRLRR